MPVTVTNSVDIVANSVQIIKDNELINVLDKITNFTGLPPETMDSLEKIANAMDNDPNFFQTIADGLGAKLDTQTFNDTMTDVNAEFDVIDGEFETINSARY